MNSLYEQYNKSKILHGSQEGKTPQLAKVETKNNNPKSQQDASKSLKYKQMPWMAKKKKEEKKGIEA